MIGMKDVFSNAADLSGIDGTKNLKVSDVIHQAFVEVIILFLSFFG